MLFTIWLIVNAVPAGLQVVTPLMGVQVGKSYSVSYSLISWALVADVVVDVRRVPRDRRGASIWERGTRRVLRGRR